MNAKDETEKLVGQIKEKLKFSQLIYAGMILIIALTSVADSSNQAWFGTIRFAAFVAWILVIVWEHSEIGRIIKRYETEKKER